MLACHVDSFTNLTCIYGIICTQVQFIEPRHYNDVIEERFIDKLCGWPLCNHTLPDTPLPKYRVSMSQRTVVDLTERNVLYSSLA